ncbi:hypothetical protein FB451DRAFT_1500391 [Mycena latifolia]|nr:hypothetical protein FB451DRAFT_1500391 [Mycena latifolia]
MAPSATLCNVPLSTSFNYDFEKSLLSLDWVLTSGLCPINPVVSGPLTLPYHDAVDTVCSAHMQLFIASSLPFDLVLGRDWLLLCREALPNAHFYLSSGILDSRPPQKATVQPFVALLSMDVDENTSPQLGTSVPETPPYPVAHQAMDTDHHLSPESSAAALNNNNQLQAVAISASNCVLQFGKFWL